MGLEAVEVGNVVFPDLDNSRDQVLMYENHMGIFIPGNPSFRAWVIKANTPFKVVGLSPDVKFLQVKGLAGGAERTGYIKKAQFIAQATLQT